MLFEDVRAEGHCGQLQPGCSSHWQGKLLGNLVAKGVAMVIVGYQQIALSSAPRRFQVFLRSNLDQLGIVLQCQSLGVVNGLVVYRMLIFY